MRQDYTILFKGIIPTVHPEIATRLCHIETENYEPVKRKLAELYGYSQEHVDKGIDALKQYYTVALLDPSNPHALSSTLDPFWHTHMLFSRQYAEFCKQIVGEFMHHEPLDKTNEVAVQDVTRKYQYTMEIHPQLFTEVDKTFWPSVEKAGIICWHGGNQDMYFPVQRFRLFEPRPEFQPNDRLTPGHRMVD